jgi:hypothetical protein
MATTTNYGWTTPDDTALVKDGAAAIRTLGSSVDTTTKALNPSTTLGDIEYRSSTANTNTRLGIGSSGQALTVVAGAPSWAASSTSVLTTTGDTLYASAANTLARLGIGSTGNVLTVAGGVPSWVAPASGSLTLLSTTTLSGASTTISSIDQTYQSLYVLINGVTNSTNDADFNCLPNNVNNLVSMGGFDQGSIFGGIYASYIRLTGTNVEYKRSDANNVWTIRFDNYASTTAMKPFIANSSFIEPSYSDSRAVFLAGTFRSNTAISSLVFDVEGETFSTGTVKIYGVK